MGKKDKQTKVAAVEAAAPAPVANGKKSSKKDAAPVDKKAKKSSKKAPTPSESSSSSESESESDSDDSSDSESEDEKKVSERAQHTGCLPEGGRC